MSKTVGIGDQQSAVKDGDWVVLYVVTRDGGIVGQLERKVFPTQEEAIGDYWTNLANHAVKTAMWWMDSKYAPQESLMPLVDKNGEPVKPGDEGRLSVSQKVRRWKPDDGRKWGGMICYGQVHYMDGPDGAKHEMLDVANERTEFSMEDALKFTFMTDQYGYLNERYAAAEASVVAARRDDTVDDAATARMVRVEAEIEHACRRLNAQIQELGMQMFGKTNAAVRATAAAAANAVMN